MLLPTPHYILTGMNTSRTLLLALLCAVACDLPSSAPVAPDPAPHAPLASETVLYEIFVPDFTREGTFSAIIPRLEELRDLGITTLWLMPIHPIGVEKRKGALGSPYAVRDYYAVNPAYGTTDTFRELVNAVHEAGMYIMMDFVANHTAWDHSWTTEHPDWYTPGEDGPLSVPASPDGTPTNWTDVADLNYDSQQLRDEMINAMRFWVSEFDIDGYRCDVAEWVPYDFWADAIRAVRAVKPVLMLAEAGDVALHAAGFDMTYAWPFYGTLKAVWEGQSARTLGELTIRIERAMPAGTRRLRFTTNHDETAWDRTPPQIFGGQHGARAASLLAHTMPGVPLLYNGQETGRTAPVPFFEKTVYDWSAHPEMRAHYTRFFSFHAESAALREGSFHLLSQSDDILAFARETNAEQVLVIVNVRPRSAAFTLPTTLKGDRLTEIFRDEGYVVGQTLSLSPYDYRLIRVE